MNAPRVAPKTVLVVGNTDGIGLCLTELLLERGISVVGVSRRDASIHHARYRHHVLDVARPDYPAELEECTKGLARLDGLAYCAGIGERTSPAELGADVRVFEVNLMGALRTVQVVLPRMLEAKGGRILILSSQADALLTTEAISYCASKAALSSFFEGLALKLQHSGVRLCNVRFGFVDTKMARAGWQPFRLTRDQAASRLVGLLEGRCPLRVTYPRRMAILVGVLARLQRLRVLFG